MIASSKFFKKSVKLSAYLLVLLIPSCVTVRQADLDAWENVPVIELESHPVFNAMELQKKTLSDGSTLWSYTKHGGTFQNCSGNTQTSGTAVTEEKTRKDSYDRRGYDPYGYDRSGYDRYGYDRYGYDRRGMDRHGVKRKTEVTTTSDSTSTNSSCVSGEYICTNQFLVNKQNMVVWYRPTGNNCYTDCSFRPRSRPCPK